MKTPSKKNLPKLPYIDVAIDVESLGTRWDAPVISIGAVAFDRRDGSLGQEFYQEIDFASACKNARVDGETVAWWMRQSAEARQLFQETGRVKLALATALQEFTSWGRALPGRIQPWGNGATADITWLEHAYDTGTVGLKEPWHFRDIRDMRTLLDLAVYLTPDFEPWSILPGAFPKEPVAHNALDDAKSQALVLGYTFMHLQRCVIDDEI